MQKWHVHSNWPFNIMFGYSLMWREFFAPTWLQIWENLHTPNARWLAHYGLQIWHENLWRCATIVLFPSSGSHFLVKLIGPLYSSPLFPSKYHLSHVSRHPNKSYFNLKTYLRSFHNEHHVKCTQNTPFVGFGSWVWMWHHFLVKLISP